MRWAIALFAVIAMGSALSAEQDTHSGNWWLQVCTTENVDRFCYGYIAALADYNDNFQGPSLFCTPAGVTVEQAVRVVIKSLQSDPSTLHKPFFALSTRALRKAFPCASDVAPAASR